MLLGLLGVPALAAIYWLRSRSQRVVVSSLVLWLDQRRPQQGGRVLQRMQTPLTFFLELLAIALLAMAAAGPALVRKEAARSLVVVLDDSYSMLACKPGADGNSPRRQAEIALVEELARDNYVTRFLLAGAEPRQIGQSLRTLGEARDCLAAWECQGPWADLRRAIAAAAELGGRRARILVLTDQAPAMKIEGGQIQWWAFGSKLPNLAITAATRCQTADSDRLLIEVTNLSDAPARAVLRVRFEDDPNATTGTVPFSLARKSGQSPPQSANGDSPIFAETKIGTVPAQTRKPGQSPPQRLAFDLTAGGSRQFFRNLPLGSPALRVSLDHDVLDIDNNVVLLPEPTKPLRVAVDLAEPSLRKAVVKVLEATGMTVEVSERPELVIADRAIRSDTRRVPKAADGTRSVPDTLSPASEDAWRLEIFGGDAEKTSPARGAPKAADGTRSVPDTEGDTASYIGPFVIDRTHPLCEGLSLEAAIWSCPAKLTLTGTPVITAGNVVLLTDRTEAGGRHRLQMGMIAETSNWQELDDWPILFTNLVRWRRGAMPGAMPRNARLGQIVTVHLPPEVKEVELTPAAGPVRKLEVRGRQVHVAADHVGSYSVRAGDNSYRFACNAVSRDESDLRGAARGRWGDWNDSAEHQDRRISLRWAFGLLALGTLGGHLAAVVADSRRRNACGPTAA
jgi:hypothetical protein